MQIRDDVVIVYWYSLSGYCKIIKTAVYRIPKTGEEENFNKAINLLLPRNSYNNDFQIKFNTKFVSNYGSNGNLKKIEVFLKTIKGTLRLTCKLNFYN